MELRVQKSHLLRGLRLAQAIADRKNTMPILANVLLRTDGKSKMVAAATDLNISVSAEIAAEVQEEGGVTVGAKTIHEIVASLPGEDLILKRGENFWAHLRAGKVECKVVGMADRDFPKLPDHREAKYTKLETGTFREMVDKTLFAVCQDETRFHLSGLLFESDGMTARMVATDGHRLCKIERSMPGAPQLSRGVIIPRKGLIEIKRALDGHTGPAEFAVQGTQLFVCVGDIALGVKLIDSQFPPYDQVIPKTNEREVVVSREALLESLKRACLMASETRGVRLGLEKGCLHVASDNPELGEVREDLEATYHGSPVSIGFNPKYMVELLSEMNVSQVRLELSGELDPVVIRPAESKDYLGVVMPMRI